MNIFYALDNNFISQTGASICSICENNVEAEEIVFYLASFGITEHNKQLLTDMINSYNRFIYITEIDDLDAYFDFEFDSSGWPSVTLARLLIDKIVPHNVNRILYLDGDIIVRDSLYEFWNTNLDSYILAMSAEPTANKNRKETLNLRGYPYYNAGVMLIDLKQWREKEVRERIFNYFKSHDGKLFAADQDAINGTLKDEIKMILPKYNFYNIYYQYSYRFMKKLMEPLEYFSEKEYYESVNNPVIIHYLGEERPWRKGNTHKYKNEYKKYLYKTPWKDITDEDGWELYFICWRIFNLIMKPFPSLRYSIINSLIPVFINYRSKKIKK